MNPEAPNTANAEAAFWRARYLELLQNHAQIVALMAKRDQQAEQAQKVNQLGEALKQRMEGQLQKPEGVPEPVEPALKVAREAK